MSNFRKLLSFLIIVATAIMMSGCFPDMGEFEDELDYVDSFGDVYLYYEKDGVIKRDKYDFSDFFYEDIGEKFVVPDSMDSIPYSYMAVEIDDDLKIQEFCLFVLGDTTGSSINVDVITSSSLLNGSMLRPYNSGTTYTVHNDETDEDEEVPYPDPFSSSQFHSSAPLTKGKWESFGCHFCSFKGKEISGTPLEVKDGDYLIFRFKNNTAYGKDEGAQKANFQTTALLIRAI